MQHNERPYSKRWEQRHWNLALVLAHLADYCAVRQVDRQGRVSVYNRHHHVGASYHGQHIFVSLDPVDGEWVFSTTDGTQIRRKLAEEITRDRIQKLQVTNRRTGPTKPRGKTECRD